MGVGVHKVSRIGRMHKDRVQMIALFETQNGEIKVYKAELFHLRKQKDKVDEVSYLVSIVCAFLYSKEQIKTNLKETQKRVDNSKAEITRIISELSPAEVGLK